MTHKLISLFITTLLTTSLVAASGLTISGVYYDPVQAEIGGEAIQLENLGSQPLDLNTITLVTKQSRYPLPSTTMLPGQAFLIADNNWSTLRDNLSWPLADLEISMSLSNTDGFAQLEQDNGSGPVPLHELAWNSSFKAKEGFMLTPSGPAAPTFRNMQSTSTDVPATIVVQQAAPVIANITVTDDAPDPGIQLLSFDRVIQVSAALRDPNGDNLTVGVTFLGGRYAAQETNGTWSANVHFTPLPPGDYSINVEANDGQQTTVTTIQITVLASTSLSVSGNLTLAGKPDEIVNASFTVQNGGNLARSVVVQHTIPNLQCDSNSFILQPDEDRLITCTMTIPRSAAGSYTHNLRLLSQ